MRRTRQDVNDSFRGKLHQPLKFGDMDQIQTLKQWRRDLEEIEEEERARNDPTKPLIKWCVSYSYREQDSQTVEARTAEEAEEIVREEEEYSHDDLDIESVGFIEVVKK